MELSRELKELKMEIAAVQKKKSDAQSKQFGKSMAAQFLASVRGSDDIQVFGSNTKKRSSDSLTDNTAASSSVESQLKKTITIDECDNSSTSSLNTAQKSNSDRDSCVSANNNK